MGVGALLYQSMGQFYNFTCPLVSTPILEQVSKKREKCQTKTKKDEIKKKRKRRKSK